MDNNKIHLTNKSTLTLSHQKFQILVIRTYLLV